MVGEAAVFDQQAIVVLGHVRSLIIQANKAIDKLAIDKGVVGVHPAARDPVNQVLVVVGIGSIRIAAHKADILETIGRQTATKGDNDCGVFRGR